jgi:hypothetical protein
MLRHGGRSASVAWDTGERTEPAGAPILAPQPPPTRGSNGERPASRTKHRRRASHDRRLASPFAPGSRVSPGAVAPGQRERLLCIRRTSRAQRRQAGRRASASSTVSSAAAARSSAGIHSGKGTSIVRWAPDRVCTSSTAARRSRGNRSATRTRAGQTRRWSKVIFPSTRRVATTSGESRTRVSTAKISWPDRCPHQLPRIGPPTICSARFGTGPRADCNTTPCSHTQSSGSTNPIQTRDLASATPASARGAAKRVDAERRWTRTYLPRDSCASPNGLPSESLQIAHAFPGWTTLPPSASTRSTALVRSLTAK